MADNVSMREDKNREMAYRIAQAVDAAGGRTFYVGGMVRDHLLGRENKDIDIEVHGILPETLRDILGKLGNVTTMGASFGILGLQHYDIDIAMPRRENATGRGHKDFEIFVDPFLGPEKAALRRDFTMNALMEDVLTGEILDFFGGREDMRQSLIRHVDDRTFAEDPLRVLRGAQFAARFGYQIADETIAISKEMDLTALPKERVFGELEKALMKAEKPSVFFEQMRRMEQLDDWFPEIRDLIGLPQNPEHHPEGDVWMHTMMVLDQAALLREQAKEPLWFMMAALVHDAGKARVTEIRSGKVTAYGHEKAGVPVAEAFLGRLSAETRLQRYVLNMTLMHMRPNRAWKDHSGEKTLMHMFDESICPEDLILLSKADRLGRVDPPDYSETEAYLRAALDRYYELMARPFVQGRDLAEAGIRPGPVYKDALELAHKLRLAGVEKEEALRQTLGYLRSRQVP